MLEALEPAIGPLWAYSALMLAFTSLVVFWFGVKITDGAGFYCLLAMIRLVQRISMMMLSVAAMAACAHILEVRHNPPPVWLFLHFAFFFASVTSSVRLLWAPKIPEGTSWKRPVLPKDVVIQR